MYLVVGAIIVRWAMHTLLVTKALRAILLLNTYAVEDKKIGRKEK